MPYSKQVRAYVNKEEKRANPQTYEIANQILGTQLFTVLTNADSTTFQQYGRKRYRQQNSRGRGGTYYSDDEYNEREGSFGESVKRYTPEEFAKSYWNNPDNICIYIKKEIRKVNPAALCLHI